MRAARTHVVLTAALLGAAAMLLAPTHVQAASAGGQMALIAPKLAQLQLADVSVYGYFGNYPGYAPYGGYYGYVPQPYYYYPPYRYHYYSYPRYPYYGRHSFNFSWGGHRGYGYHGGYGHRGGYGRHGGYGHHRR